MSRIYLEFINILQERIQALLRFVCKFFQDYTAVMHQIKTFKLKQLISTIIPIIGLLIVRMILTNQVKFSDLSKYEYCLVS